MSNLFVTTKLNLELPPLGHKCNSYKKNIKIDRTETCFGGKGCLTKEQYEKAMSLSRQMREMSVW